LCLGGTRAARAPGLCARSSCCCDQPSIVPARLPACLPFCRTRAGARTRTSCCACAACTSAPPSWASSCRPARWRRRRPGACCCRRQPPRRQRCRRRCPWRPAGSVAAACALPLPAPLRAVCCHPGAASQLGAADCCEWGLASLVRPASLANNPWLWRPLQRRAGQQASLGQGVAARAFQGAQRPAAAAAA
jgi:hypothetical protein